MQTTVKMNPITQCLQLPLGSIPKNLHEAFHSYFSHTIYWPLPIIPRTVSRLYRFVDAGKRTFFEWEQPCTAYIAFNRYLKEYTAH